LGKLTISVLNLNEQDRLVKKRFEIGNALHNKLEQLNELLDDYVSGVQSSTKRRNRIVNGLKELMREGLPTAIYAATSASVILTDIEYLKIKKQLALLRLWDSDFVQIENDLKTVALKLYLK
jgi:hypothetical protein